MKHGVMVTESNLNSQPTPIKLILIIFLVKPNNNSVRIIFNLSGWKRQGG